MATRTNRGKHICHPGPGLCPLYWMLPLIYERWQWIFGYPSSFVVARLYHPQCHLPQGQGGMISFLKVASTINESVSGQESSQLLIIVFSEFFI